MVSHVLTSMSVATAATVVIPMLHVPTQLVAIRVLVRVAIQAMATAVHLYSNGRLMKTVLLMFIQITCGYVAPGVPWK